MTFADLEQLNRKYWELCGWKRYEGPFEANYPGWYAMPSGHLRPLFQLHIHADLLIKELDKVFPNGYQITRMLKTFCVSAPRKDVEMLEERGVTFEEAALRAMIAAKEVRPAA